MNGSTLYSHNSHSSYSYNQHMSAMSSNQSQSPSVFPSQPSPPMRDSSEKDEMLLARKIASQMANQHSPYQPPSSV
jgi:hypothetical protein